MGKWAGKKVPGLLRNIKKTGYRSEVTGESLEKIPIWGVGI